MCLMLDQFLWGHSSRDCDISCFKTNFSHNKLSGTLSDSFCRSWSKSNLFAKIMISRQQNLPLAGKVLMIILMILLIILSHDVTSGSDITPCNKMDKPLVVYRFSGNVITPIITLPKIRENLDVFRPKMQFLSIFNVM